MDITIKRAPGNVYQTIKREAKKQGRSLNSQIVQTLQTQAAEIERRNSFDELRDEIDRFVASLPPMEDGTLLIREDRER